ncbi:hypothetical protein [uncultured Dubosiella sp.]|uniref:hypothetical protein n=1 Tax=uncultured Dubosiella sp. TaxID=1937011 RepID=UPI0026074D66|nr:hypothetical protein [uncultured Dubosiella sp.]
MLYLSGIHALNTNCLLNTTGDWHSSALKWDVVNQRLIDSKNSIFEDYGIEVDKDIPFANKDKKYNVANHIRACLDLLSEGKFAELQGMRKDFICTDEYDNEIFEKVCLLKDQSNWQEIDDFMEKEYMLKWLNYKKKRGVVNQ